MNRLANSLRIETKIEIRGVVQVDALLLKNRNPGDDGVTWGQERGDR